MATNHDIINEIRKSYAIELETVQNCLANSIDLDGVRAEEIKSRSSATSRKKSVTPEKWATGSRCSKAACPARSIWTAPSLFATAQG